MYASRKMAMVGDVVQGSGGEGEVLEVTQHGSGGETATVQWTTPYEKVAGSGIYAPLSPVPVLTRLLKLVRRKTA